MKSMLKCLGNLLKCMKINSLSLSLSLSLIEVYLYVILLIQYNLTVQVNLCKSNLFNELRIASIFVLKYECKSVQVRFLIAADSKSNSNSNSNSLSHPQQ